MWDKLFEFLLTVGDIVMFVVRFIVLSILGVFVAFDWLFSKVMKFVISGFEELIIVCAWWNGCLLRAVYFVGGISGGDSVE